MAEFVAILAAFALPVVALCLHRRTRPHAHVPLAIVSILISAAVGSSMGAFLRAASLAPEQYRCGLPLSMGTGALFMTWGAVAGVGMMLLMHSTTAGAGQRVLLKVLPSSILIAVLFAFGARLWP